MNNSNNSLETLLQGTGISTRQNSTNELLDKFNLNWKVKKQPLFLDGGIETGFYGIVRDDNHKTFATCKEGYQPYQNEELLDLVNRASGQMGLTVSKGGTFKDGALVFLQIDSGLVTGIGENNDIIEKYITALNSHDGSCSLRWGITNKTISCQNKFWSAYREVKNSVRHTASMHAKIDETIRDIQRVQEKEKTLYEKFFKMASIPATQEHIAKVVKVALDIDVNEKADKISSYKNNRLDELSSAILTEMDQKGETLWGLFSGVTKYTSHIMPGSEISREQSKAIGKGYSIDNEVFQELELEFA